MSKQKQIETLWGMYCNEIGHCYGEVKQSVPGTYELWLKRVERANFAQVHFGSFNYIKGYIQGRISEGNDRDQGLHRHNPR